MNKKNVLLRMLASWKGYYKWLIFSLILIIGSVLGTLSIPYFSAVLINQGIMVGNTDIITTYGIYMLLAAIFAGICEIVNTLIAVKFSEETAHDLRVQAYNQIQTFSFGTWTDFIPVTFW